MTLRTTQNIFLPKNINAVTNCIENSTVSRGIWEDVTNSGNGEPGTGVWEQVYSGNPLENSKWRLTHKKRLEEKQFGLR